MRRRFSQLSLGDMPRGAGGQLGRMILFLIVLAFMYSWTRDPKNWQWINLLGTQAPNQQPADPAPIVAPSAEAVEPGPNDRDPAEMAEAQNQFEAVDDGKKLTPPEMPAYWRLMRWARSEKFADLERRAVANVRYAQLWDAPNDYRGKLVRLRVHVRRVVTWSAPENSAGVKQVYEAWGWTDDSQSLPFVLVLSELPPGLQVGDSVFADGIFVGYFLKMLWYVNAEGKQQTAPLLIGQMAKVASPQDSATAATGWTTPWLSGLAVAVVAAAIIIIGFLMAKRRRKPSPAASAASDEEVQDWLKQQSSTEDGQ